MPDNDHPKPYPQAPKLDTTQRIRAARSEVSLYCDTLADWLIAGFIPLDEARREHSAAIIAIGVKHLVPPDHIDDLILTEWNRAHTEASQRIQAVRKAIRNLAWEGAPTAAILEAALATADRVHASLGAQQCADLVVHITQPIDAARRRRNQRP